MIRHCCIGLFLLIALLDVACNSHSSSGVKQTVSTESDKKKAPGKIEFSKEMHNFGTLKEGEIVVFSFQFKNTGGSSFRLTRVEPTCGCLTVEYNKEEIPSQASSSIDVAFHSDGEWGNLIKTVNVETSSGESKCLTIGAFVENKNFNFDLNNLK